MIGIDIIRRIENGQRYRVIRWRRALFRIAILATSPILIVLASLFSICCLLSNPLGFIALGSLWEDTWNYRGDTSSFW